MWGGGVFIFYGTAKYVNQHWYCHQLQLKLQINNRLMFLLKRVVLGGSLLTEYNSVLPGRSLNVKLTKSWQLNSLALELHKLIEKC